ncbi:chromate resistance protein ChrB domain-containing protein [Pseudomonas aeruginosa]|uniref:Chromate resistance protein n=1 Tax=Pseudomonas aeruginosa TaxID=287 RepID=A0A5F1CEM2_PSEAI|nr:MULTISPECIES: chromate resistance protein ChrB domain-containing protein [Pseudomonas]MBA5107710.1 chromate resistance protein [Pseudomonas aeruginosa]MBD1300161.1 chromate resistance protein [Pseudomonas aeruginosa]MBD1340726.1 chromate resistance protein [Pseudomonas aeruginosa]MBG4604300.1 chromate resistance protein [Pseudomonas aeruginosa]MBH3592826.1 chromate resistance protein [Pseudomonas aeruginosa]
MKNWLALILGLPTANATERMRAWRALKASGAAVLRDGAYLLPDTGFCREVLASIERDILAINGTAYTLPVVDPDGERFVELFDRSEDYAGLRAELDECRAQLNAENALASTKQIRKLRKAYDQLIRIDYFPGKPKQQLDSALQELETAVSRALSADEPHSRDQPITALNLVDYQGRVWATRKRPWVDRLACAWLIRRFIDPNAQILWLDTPQDCPVDVLGFDFDDATFSHVGNRVTFETLQASFELQEPGLNRIAALVHYLDIGGIQPLEAAGIERVLAGLRETITHDDHLLAAASAIFDGLLAGFVKEEQPNE